MFKKSFTFLIVIFCLIVVNYLLTVSRKSNIFGNLLDKIPCKSCNIILISIDTLRSKSLSCYGYKKNTSPNLCEFAKNAYLFSNTYSQSSYTLDSHLATMTSLYPSSHKVITAYKDFLSPEIKTLAQILKESGYTTVYNGILTDSHLPLNKGLERGFEIFQKESSFEKLKSTLSDLKSNNKKFFLFFHTYKLHDPYTPKAENYKRFGDKDNINHISDEELCEETLNMISEKYSNEYKKFQENYPNNKEKKSCFILENFKDFSLTVLKFDRDVTFKITLDIWNSKITSEEEYLSLYEAEIFELDTDLKNLFDHLKQTELLNNSIVIITGDHGEAFGEHGKWRHVNNLYNETIKVPLIIYIPYTKGGVIKKLAQNIDIVPSLLPIVGIDSLFDQFQGINLFSKKENKYIYSERFINKQQAVITNEWKLIVFNEDAKQKKIELYNIKRDPNETDEVSKSNPRVVDMLINALEIHNREKKLFEVYESDFPINLNEEEKKKLIETGYF